MTPTRAPIAKGRLGKPVEFGYKAQIVDNEDGVIVDHNIEAGNVEAPSLDHELGNSHGERRPRSFIASDLASRRCLLSEPIDQDRGQPKNDDAGQTEAEDHSPAWREWSVPTPVEHWGAPRTPRSAAAIVQPGPPSIPLRHPSTLEGHRAPNASYGRYSRQPSPPIQRSPSALYSRCSASSSAALMAPWFDPSNPNPVVPPSRRT